VTHHIRLVESRLRHIAICPRTWFWALVSISSVSLLVLAAVLTVPCIAQAQSHGAVSPKILAAKSIYFDNQTGSAAAGQKALNELKKWGRFEIVPSPQDADLILLFSVERYEAGTVVFGKTIQAPDKPAPASYAYLTVIDPKTGESLWSDGHDWGGLITGWNRAGQQLVEKLRKQIQK
jgi:hypothetical protein